LGWNVLDANVEVTTFCFDRAESWPSAFCLDLTESGQKDQDVLASVLTTYHGDAKSEPFTICATRLFERLPNSAIAYNFPPPVRRIFTLFDSLATRGHRALQGHNLSMEKFARLVWEIPAQQLGSGEFIRMYKGGGFSLYYQPSYEAALWRGDGSFLKTESGTRWGNEQFQGREAIGYGKRGDHLDAHILPRGHIFTVEGLAVFPQSKKVIWSLLGILNSRICSLLLSYYSRQHKEAGYVGQLPLPNLEGETADLDAIGSIAKECFSTKRLIDRHNELSPEFIYPLSLPARAGNRVSSDVGGAAKFVLEAKVRIVEETARLDELVAGLYHIPDRRLTEFSFLATRPEDNLSLSLDFSDEPGIERTIVAAIISFLIGAVLGRWDIRYATGERLAPELPEPFAPLPVCPPGMLQGEDGLPLAPEAGSLLWANGRYPLDVTWDGILVDDLEHPLDLERRAREALETLWGDRADALEHEACALLGVPTLREWFRRPAGFFADHLKRYSKSRRQAPVYWPLSTKSGSYTLWIYYHRLTPDTLYKCVQQFVKPKLVDVEKELTHLRIVLAANEGGTKERKRADDLETLRRELVDFRAELELWAPRWKPNLNDGVLITASPLWKLFRLPKWQKDLKACWQQLEQGDYDWAHLAYSLWPDRVREKCRSDRSLAIAHGLEDICVVKVPVKKPKKVKGTASATMPEFETGS